MEHYDELKDRKNWWGFINEKKRQNDRGMNSLDLLRAVLAGNHVPPAPPRASHPTTCSTCCNHMAITWQSHGNHIAIT